ncbi:ACT domain-containing protein [Actinoalloteichus caeruleus]|uniref:ACT domain-containing protein n=1 Tax=Actinoalloteichus cyanogriseus TaxID=2893586 RepID=UPI001B8064F1|nr:ACT domain-containing protein [Actinoalloteichus caeruleus]
MTRTEAELSVVRPAAGAPTAPAVEPGWRLPAVDGPRTFPSPACSPAWPPPSPRPASALFAVSTFDTDYPLVTSDRLPGARRALAAAGYLVEGEPAGQRP